MSITNPSPNVLVNGSPTINGIDIFFDAEGTIIFQLEDAAGVNVWVLELIGADEINNDYLTEIGGFILNDVVPNVKYIDTASVKAAYPATFQKGSAFIFRSTVNSGIDINGNVRPDFVTTFAIFVPAQPIDYTLPGQFLRVGGVNEITEGDEEVGWTSKLNEAIRKIVNIPFATTVYPGIITLAGDLGGTALVPKVLKINGTSVPASPNANEVLTAVNSSSSDWKFIDNSNVDVSANIAVTKLASGLAGQVLMNNSTPIPQWTSISGDVSLGSTGATTLVALRGKTLNASLASIGAAQDGYVLTWNDGGGFWSAEIPTGGGGGGTVVWDDDLVTSTDFHQYVTNVYGRSDGFVDSTLSGRQVCSVGRSIDTSGEFYFIKSNPNAVAPADDFYIQGAFRNAASGFNNGGNVIVRGGFSSVGGVFAGGAVGGDVTIIGGTIAGDAIISGGDGQNASQNGGLVQFNVGKPGSGGSGQGYFNFNAQTDAGAKTVIASFGTGTYGATIDPTAFGSGTAPVTINSGTGGSVIYSDGYMSIGGNGVGVTSDTGNTTISSAIGKVLLYGQFGLATIGNGTEGQYGAGSITFNQNVSTTTNATIAAGTSSTTGGSLKISPQAGSGGSVGGSLFLCGGGSTGNSNDGIVVIAGGPNSGPTARITVSSTAVTVASLAGFGTGYVAVDGAGVLSFTNSVTPGGAAGGDLSGTYPNPTVAKINGTSVDASPNADEVLTATSSTVSDWKKIVNANVDNSAAIAYSKLNLSGAIVNADVNASAAIAYSKLNLSGAIVNADVSTSAAIAVSKLAAGTGGQFLINNTTPTPTWVTLSNDVVLSNTSGAMRVDSFGHGTSSAYVFPTVAGSTGNTMFISSAGILSFGALNLAGGSAYVTGTLPAGNQASQTMTGDVSGTTGANVVDKIKSRVVNDTDPNNGDVLTWDEANNYWEYTAPPSSPVTWANDLVGSTSTNQYVAAISGNAGGGGTIPVNADGFEFDDTIVTPLISQADEVTDHGDNLTIQAQNATASTKEGGDLILTSGTGDGAGRAGDVVLMAGGTERLHIYPNGVIQITGGTGVAYGTGILHSDSTGSLTSSTIVNADVNASAAIAVSKLAAGTSAQILLNNATPTPTWTSISGDITLSSAGAVVVTKVQGNAFKAETPGAGQDSYVLTWVNANNQFEVQPQTGGSGVTTVGTIDSQTKSANGLVISGVNIYAQTADASFPGLMSTGTQTVAGAKTFSSAITAGSTTGTNTLVGANKFTTRSLAADLTIDTTTTDMIILVSTAAARAITLPAPVNGRVIIIKDKTGQAETNNITLIRNGSEQIEGVAASRILSTNWGVWTITTDGTDWFFI